MADKKISALDAATTPLAGTEVLPIVQSSTTKKVAVSDLTNGRAVTAGSMSIGGAINAGWGSTTRVVQTSLSGALSGSTALFRAVVSNNLYFDNTNWKYMYGISASNYEQNAGNHYWFTAPSGTADSIANLTQVMSILQANNNLKVDVGNLVIGTAGKGIDFSANTGAAGMTSELLTWYEEGTWSAVLTDGTNNATMIATTCKYTRIGRVVFVCGNVSTSSLGSVSGNISISGLPFTIASFAGGSVTYAINFNIAAGNNVQLLANNSGTSLLLFNWDAVTGTTWMQASEWTNTGNISFSAMYFV